MHELGKPARPASVMLAPTHPKTEIQLRTFVVPRRLARTERKYENVNVCAVLPTYAPTHIALRLVKDLLRWNPRIHIIVVDDCTPRDDVQSGAIFEEMRALSRVTVLKTPENTLKAGALNFALQHMWQENREHEPDVVLTLDDDVVIAPTTVKNLVTELIEQDELGAVCSQCRVLNKNKNLLTRLQGLEYVGFNAIRLADEGFLRGPLVMHGMLTAFRASALRAARGFAEGHLIEDYEVTSRLKDWDWSVKSAINAPAWTIVPETLSALWRQRTRWSYGGMTVLARAKRVTSVFQDLQGHVLFLSTIFMVFALYSIQGSSQVPSAIAQGIIALSLFQLAVWYLFQLWLMRLYAERDRWDLLIRLALIPEFIYSYLMTLALMGSYVFFFFNMLRRAARAKGGAFATILENAFRRLGYAEGRWGTR